MQKNKILIIIGLAIVLLLIVVLQGKINLRNGTSNESLDNDLVLDATRNSEQNYSMEGSVELVKSSSFRLKTGFADKSGDDIKFVEHILDVEIVEGTVVQFYNPTDLITEAQYSDIKTGQKVLVTTDIYPFDKKIVKAKKIEIQK